MERPSHQTTSVTQQGLIALQKGELSQAISLLQQAAQQHPQDFDAAHGLGVALARKNLLRQAAHWLEHAVSLRQDDVGALFNLAQVYFGLNELADAKSAVRRVLNLDPNHQRAAGLMDRIAEAESRAVGKAAAEYAEPVPGEPSSTGHVDKGRETARPISWRNVAAGVVMTVILVLAVFGFAAGWQTYGEYTTHGHTTHWNFWNFVFALGSGLLGALLFPVIVWLVIPTILGARSDSTFLDTWRPSETSASVDSAGWLGALPKLLRWLLETFKRQS